MNACAALLAYAALASLALSMNRHHRAVFGREGKPSHRLAWRVTGWTTLAASFAVSVRAPDLELGPVAWLVHLAVAGFELTLLLSFAPRWWPAPLAVLLLLALAA